MRTHRLFGATPARIALPSCVTAVALLFGATAARAGDPATEQPEQQARETVLRTLGEIGREARALRAGENRADALAAVGEILWQFDERAGREAFEAAERETEGLVDAGAADAGARCRMALLQHLRERIGAALAARNGAPAPAPGHPSGPQPASLASGRSEPATAQESAWDVFHRGDVEAAKAIARSGIVDPTERERLIAEFDRQTLRERGGPLPAGDVRALAARLESAEERVETLVDFAMTAAARGEAGVARELLEDAAFEEGGGAPTLRALTLRLRIAEGYAAIDATRSFEIVESAIDRRGEVADAAAACGEFEGDVSIRDGEFVLLAGHYVTAAAARCADLLERLAREDIGRAENAAGRFARPELRLLARLAVARSSIEDLTPLR